MRMHLLKVYHTRLWLQDIPLDQRRIAFTNKILNEDTDEAFEVAVDIVFAVSYSGEEMYCYAPREGEVVGFGGEN